MASPGTLAPERSIHDGTAPRSMRVLRRHRSLPGGRAVLGALLVAASIVGMYAAYTAHVGRAGRGPTSWRRAPSGRRPARGRRPDADARRPSRSVARTRLHRSGCACGRDRARADRTGRARPGQPGDSQARRSLARPSCLSRSRRPHRRVDPIRRPRRRHRDLRHRLRTPTHSSSPATSSWCRWFARDGTLGGESASVVLTVALPEGADTLALAHATRVAELSVVRTTGALCQSHDAGRPTAHAGLTAVDRALMPERFVLLGLAPHARRGSDRSRNGHIRRPSRASSSSAFGRRGTRAG